MNMKDTFIGNLESLFLGLFLVWTIAIGSALVSPAAHERTGTVEIHALG